MDNFGMYKTIIKLSDGEKIHFIHENRCMDYEVDFDNGFKFYYEYEKLSKYKNLEMFQNPTITKNSNFITVYNGYLVFMKTFKIEEEEEEESKMDNGMDKIK